RITCPKSRAHFSVNGPGARNNPTRVNDVLIPMKVIADSDWIPVTGSEMKLIVFGAKRRWHSYPA
ncbi:MAG: hypothetical protein WB799_18875, partial [Candidatus Sulfotelmatobacter sp.]